MTEDQQAHIRAMYVDAGLSSETIAQITGIPSRTVLRHLDRAGVKKRTAGAYPVTHYRGPGHPSWRGGGHDQTYRRIAFDAYGRACLRCGSGGRIEVHHRNRDRSDNRPANLEPLCRCCHTAEHAVERRLYRTGFRQYRLVSGEWVPVRPVVSSPLQTFPADLPREMPSAA